MNTGKEWQVPGALWTLGVLWPALYSALTQLMRSPLERALYDSWCSITPHTSLAFFGHCAWCWSGAAAFLAAGVLALSFNRQRARRGAV